MSVQTEHRFPSDLSVLDAAGSRVTLADLRGHARAVALYFMRTGTCPPCIHHVRALATLNLSGHGVQPVVVVPGSSAHAVRVRRIVDDRVTVVSSPSAEAHRPRDCTGPCSFSTAASCSSTRPGSCGTGGRPRCPPAASMARRCRRRLIRCRAAPHRARASSSAVRQACGPSCKTGSCPAPTASAGSGQRNLLPSAFRSRDRHRFPAARPAWAAP
jgi:peroxiredoxin